MNPLNDYINQSRARGQTDYQIRQALLQAGWSTEQVDAALPAHQAAPTQPTRPITTASSSTGDFPGRNVSAPTKGRGRLPKKISKLPIIIGSILALVIVIVLITMIAGGKTSYQSVANDFITGIQKQDQSKADSLESPALMNYESINTGSPSFESYCISKGQQCTSFFSQNYLTKAKVIKAVYTSQKGAKGHSLIYTTASSSASCSQNGNANGTLEIDLIPSKSSWLIDNINLVSGANRVNSSCSS